MRHSATFAFLVAAALSGLIWAFSPVLAGHAEPWDANGPYYLSALAIAGAISGALVPKRLWAHYTGCVLGQATYELIFLKVGALFVLGVAFLLAYSMIFLAGAALAAFIRVRCTGGPDAA